MSDETGLDSTRRDTPDPEHQTKDLFVVAETGWSFTMPISSRAEPPGTVLFQSYLNLSNLLAQRSHQKGFQIYFREISEAKQFCFSHA